jgi:Circularly permutated YpsA SLOG family
MELGIDHGGWVPKGRAAEDGPIPTRYRARETPSEDRAERTKRNVADSDATLLVSHAPLTGGSELTQRFAAELGKPVLHVELSKVSASEAADRIARWLGALGCRTLNVAGPRASEEPGIYAAASAVLTMLFQSTWVGDVDVQGRARKGGRRDQRETLRQPRPSPTRLAQSATRRTALRSPSPLSRPVAAPPWRARQTRASAPGPCARPRAPRPC